MLGFETIVHNVHTSISSGENIKIPAVCQKTPICMTRAIAARCWTGRALALESLPGEGSAVQKTLLLSTRCQRTAISTAVGGVLPADVPKTVTARDGTPLHNTRGGFMNMEKKHACPRCFHVINNQQYKNNQCQVP